MWSLSVGGGRVGSVPRAPRPPWMRRGLLFAADAHPVPDLPVASWCTAILAGAPYRNAQPTTQLCAVCQNTATIVEKHPLHQRMPLSPCWYM